MSNSSLVNTFLQTYFGPNPNELSSKAKVGIIVGTLFGAVAVLFLAVSALFLYRRKSIYQPVTRSDRVDE
jgi:hypothetical protein